MKVLVTGVKGQLGYDVVRRLDARGIENRGVDIDDFDLTDEQAVLSLSLIHICSIRQRAWTKLISAAANALYTYSVSSEGRISPSRTPSRESCIV